MISVIVVNYNKADLLKRCLESVKACRGGLSLPYNTDKQSNADKQNNAGKQIELIVVDNASTDNSVEMVRTHFPEAKLIQNTTNLFFSKAYNEGIKRSSGKFILCINNDVYLDKDYLKEVSCAIGKDDSIGMVSGKILREDKSTIDSTGLMLGRNRKPVERGYGKRVTGYGLRGTGQYDKEEYIFGVSGACAFYRKSMLEDIKDQYGYFDRRFRMYYEDLDVSWRAARAGWKAYYTPKAVAYHRRGGTAVRGADKDRRGGLSLPYLSDELKEEYIKNRYLCMRKNDTFKNYLINSPFILSYDILLMTYMAYVNIKNVMFKGVVGEPSSSAKATEDR
ncbi:MAG: glycosyltransferase family 2 protein [Candidatus Omnitrophota bacterium]